MRLRLLNLSAAAAAAYLTLLSPTLRAQQVPRTATPAALDRQIEFNVYLPLQRKDELDALLDAQKRPGSPNYHKWLTPAEFSSRFGPSPQDMAELSSILASSGLTVTGTHSHGVHVQGTVDTVQRALGAPLVESATTSGRTKIVAAAGLQLPAALQRMGAQVIHFAALRGAHPQSRIVTEAAAPANRYSANGPYWFTDIKQAYDFPSYKSLTGAGRTIAIMSVSDYLPSDMAAYFGHESTKAAPIAVPQIVRYFPLGTGAPFVPGSGFSLEAELDLQQAGGMAPGARLVLVDLPDSSFASFLDGYFSLVLNNSVDIVNSSFGFGAEATFNADYNGGQDFTGLLTIFDDVFKQGNAQGITFVESSGDNGGLALPPLSYFTTAPQQPPVVVGNFLPGIDAFTTSWHVTAVGGTNLHTTYDPPNLESRYVSEDAQGDPEIPYDPDGVGNLLAGGYWGSGGGKSIVYAKPPYQEFIHTGSKMRTTPDVSLQMGGCPSGIAKVPCREGDSSVVEAFGGQFVGVIGTSVSAPEFCGLLALKEQFLGGSRLGNVNYDIYALAAAQPALANTPLDLLHQGQPGFNGAFHTTATGYNLVLGVGTPLVRNFIFAPELPPAGNPQTRSNP